MRAGRIATVALAAVLLSGAERRPPPVPALALPLRCTYGVDCFVQNYVDVDPGPGVRDYRGGHRSYDGHDGVDIRVPSLVEQRAGVAVLAVAPGRVLRLRDGVPDLNVDERGKAAVANEECGNGLIVDQGGGWEAQYCHLARGSIRVKPGARVRTGTPLGRVGLSGDTQFPHVHLTIRKDGRAIDPFAWCADGTRCAHPRSLWKDRLGYQSGEVILTGFATRPLTEPEVQMGGATPSPRPARGAPALVAFAELIGLERGDVATMSIVGPAGRLAEGRLPPLDGDRATYLLSVGRKRPPGGFAPGVYQARVAIVRGGAEVILRTFRTML